MTDDDERCENCRFFLTLGRLKGGDRCRRYPPFWVASRGFGQHPQVSADNWCGEWQAQPALANEA